MKASTLKRKLQALGKTPDEVADSLRAKGIVGRQISAGCCPVANYLKSSTRESCEPSVCAYFVDLLDGVTPATRVVPGPAVANFIRNFDRDKYPDLIDPLP